MRHKDYELLDAVEKYVKGFIVEYSHSPTTLDLAQEFGFSRVCASRYLMELDKQGRIEYADGKAQYSKVSLPINVPLITRTADITNLDDADIEEYLPLPRKSVGGGKHFAIKMYDDSLLEAGYKKGDLLVFIMQNTAADGDIVAVSSPGEPLTLCRYPFTEHGGVTNIHNIEGVAVFAMCGLELE